MTDAHLHKLQLILLCDAHPGAIYVMKEMHTYKESNPSAYYRLLSHLQTNRIYGAALYQLWKETCHENYHLLLTYDVCCHK